MAANAAARAVELGAMSAAVEGQKCAFDLLIGVLLAAVVALLILLLLLPFELIRIDIECLNYALGCFPFLLVVAVG